MAECGPETPSKLRNVIKVAKGDFYARFSESVKSVISCGYVPVLGGFLSGNSSYFSKWRKAVFSGVFWTGRGAGSGLIMSGLGRKCAESVRNGSFSSQKWSKMALFALFWSFGVFRRGLGWSSGRTAGLLNWQN